MHTTEIIMKFSFFPKLTEAQKDFIAGHTCMNYRTLEALERKGVLSFWDINDAWGRPVQQYDYELTHLGEMMRDYLNGDLDYTEKASLNGVQLFAGDGGHRVVRFKKEDIEVYYEDDFFFGEITVIKDDSEITIFSPAYGKEVIDLYDSIYEGKTAEQISDMRR